MKKVEAYIRPEKLEEIKDIMSALNLSGLSVSQVMGCGKQKGWKEYIRGSEVETNFLPKIKIDTVVADDMVEPLIEKICEIAWTGEVGDGKIFVMNVEEAVRVRTKERGDAALQ